MFGFLSWVLAPNGGGLAVMYCDARDAGVTFGGKNHLKLYQNRKACALLAILWVFRSLIKGTNFIKYNSPKFSSGWIAARR